MSSRIVRWDAGEGDVAEFARRLRAHHAGDVIDVDQPELTNALGALGAHLGRRSLLMGHDLAPVPPAGAADHRLAVGAMVPEPDRYAGPLLRAFPPDHADYDPDIADEDGARRALAAYFAGDIIGPFLAAGSAEAVVDGVVAGGLVVSDRPPSDGQDGGPWVTDAFVDPAFQGKGIGWALFAHAIARLGGTGEVALGLAVHADNPAQHLYRRLGFVERSRWTRITL